MINRGDRREAIFLDEIDRKEFLRALGEACQKTGWEVHAYCLLSNHFHLVVETPQPNLVDGMKWFHPKEQRRRLDDREALESVRRGWWLGSKEFRQELLGEDA